MLTDDVPNAQPPADARGRRRAFEAAVRRDRPMTWAAWALPIHDVESLTPVGRQTALWAVSVLRESFGDRFLVKAWEHDQARPPAEPWEHVARHPVFSQGFWPEANSAPWVFANLFQLAAQLELSRTLNRQVRTRNHMRDYQDPVKWVHGLLQFEVSGLALRAGWQVSFEPPLGTGRSADVRLDGSGAPLLVETTSMRMSDREVKALATAREVSGRLTWAIHDIQARHGVQASGAVEQVTLPVEADQWRQVVESAACEVEDDGVDRGVTGPTPGMLRLTRCRADSARITVSGPVVPSDPLGRLSAKLSEKAEQAAGSTHQVWVRLEEWAFIWSFLTHSGLSFTDKFALLAPRLQQMLEPHPELAGVILAPVALWEIGVEPASLNVTIAASDGSTAAVRSGLPGHRMRETVIVARRSVPDNGLEFFTRWYADEAGWLDWALGKLGHPPFAELISKSVGGAA
jgi:hypothetical protein